MITEFKLISYLFYEIWNIISLSTGPGCQINIKEIEIKFLARSDVRGKKIQSLLNGDQGSGKHDY